MRSKDISADSVEVVFIGGYGRSGSTILDILIGNFEGVVGVGELVNIYQYWIEGNDDKNINEEVHAFWERVKHAYMKRLRERVPIFAVDEREHFRDMQKNQKYVESIWFFLATSKRKETYRVSLRSLYEAISEVSGCSTIVDSSKTAWLSAFRPRGLLKVAGLSISCLHVVRHPYQVVLSMKKGDNVKMEKGSSDVSMLFPVLRGALGWTLANILCFYQCRSYRAEMKSMVLQHENFVDSPMKEVSNISRFVGKDCSSLLDRMDKGEKITSKFLFSGNRVRMLGFSSVQKNKDKHLSIFEKLICDVVTLPIRLKFYSGNNVK